MDLISRMRDGRRSPAALKIALSHIRSSKADAIVFVFEGVDDVGPYEVWIARCAARPEYEPLPGKGKDQLLAFRQMLNADTTGLKRGVFFFVDKDFDGLKGFPTGRDLFIHETYSAENCLASEEVLESLLNDELRCAGSVSEREAVLAQFFLIRERFHELVREVNLRLFVAVRSAIKVINLQSSIFGLVSVELAAVTLTEEALVRDFLRLEREPTTEEMTGLIGEFDTLVPAKEYRGKFELQMFVKWVGKLAEDRCAERPVLFNERAKTGNIQAALSLRSLASRCILPSGLEHFVNS
jgi:hypothetical protein